MVRFINIGRCVKMSYEPDFYSGNSINVEEMPQGCVISDKKWGHPNIVVDNLQDARYLINSLQRLIASRTCIHGFEDSSD